MVKRFIIFVLCFVLAFSLFGCSLDDFTPTTPSIGTSEEQQDQNEKLPTDDVDNTSPTQGDSTSPTLDDTTPTEDKDDDTKQPTTKPNGDENENEKVEDNTTKPTDPKPTDPKPTEPEETNPSRPVEVIPPVDIDPTEPKPTEPKPTEPKPTEPKPTEPDPEKPDGTVTDRVVVKIEDIPIVNDDDVDNIEIETPELKEEVEVESHHTAVSEGQYYQYTSLTNSEKAIYNQLVDAIKNTTNVIKVENTSISYNRGLILLQKVISDNPQYFWVSKSTSILYNPNTNNITAFILYYTDGVTTDKVNNKYELTETANRTTIKNKIVGLNNKVSDIIAKIPVNASDVEKERIIHDYIMQNVSYDNDAASRQYVYGDTLPHAFDIYGAACNGKAVCEGYSKLFQYLCYCVGVKSSAVVGTSNGANHMWNVVNLDGNWYHVDVTWDDTSSSAVPYYGYFNLTTNDIKADHTIDTSNLKVPTCTATKYNFHSYYALNFSDTDKTPVNYQDVIDYAVKNKLDYLIISNKNNQVEQSMLRQHILVDNSVVQKYILEKSYSIDFELKYRTLGDFIYIPIVSEN